MLAFLVLALAGPPLPDPTLVEGGMLADNPDAAAAPTRQSAFGRLTVEALVPVEILVDNVKLAQLWSPAITSFSVAAGPHVLRIYTWGKPTDQAIAVQPDHDLRVVVSRAGLSVASTELEAADVDHVPVAFRVMGGLDASIRLDGERHLLGAGKTFDIDLSPGAHDLSLRSRDGTVIWATGRLHVASGEPIVVHVLEGRMPEVSGAGRFDSGQGG